MISNMLIIAYEYLKHLLILILDLEIIKHCYRDYYRVKKRLLYIFTGKHEFERICADSCDIYEKTMQVERWLMRTNNEVISRYWRDNVYYKTLDANSPVRHTIDKLSEIYEPEERKKGKPKHVIGTTLVNLEDVDSMLGHALDHVTDKLLHVVKRHKKTKLWVAHKKILRDVLYRIVSYNMSLMVMVKMAGMPYDSTNQSHTKILRRLWNDLVRRDRSRKSDGISTQAHVIPSELRSEIEDDETISSSRWSHIGFQGEDPGTDFRGMGLLGLEQLAALLRRKNLGLDLLRRSLNQEHEYPFAIVGINVTYNLLNLFKDGSMKNLYYDSGDVLFRNESRKLNLRWTLNDLYIELFLRFDCFWHESKPKDIFAFRELMEKFINIIKMDLCNRTFSFKFIY